jgi:adenine-specific DNA-methyltransferase
MAKSWAATLSDDYRIASTRAFLAKSVTHYAETLARTYNIDVAITPPPTDLTSSYLDASAEELAKTLGEAATAFDYDRAGYNLSIVYTGMLPSKMRSEWGIYYTPPALTERLLNMATEAGVDWTRCRVLDPACGGGAFLAPAALRIVEALSDCDPAIIVQNIAGRLRGFEIDPFAAWLSQVFLEIALAETCRQAGRSLPQLVTVCDSLDSIPAGEGFDLVIGNPPYGRIGLTPDQRQRYRRSLYGHANLYGVFTDIALRWTAKGGVIAYVTPTSFLAGEYSKALRSLLASNAPPVAVDFISDRKGVFEDVLQETLLATYRRGADADTAAVHYLKVAAEDEIVISPAGDFNLPADPAEPWLLPRLPEHAPLIARMAGMPTRLSNWGYKVSTGPLVWNRYKKQLRKRNGAGVYPLIWAESVYAPGQFEHRANRRNHEPYFKLRGPQDDWLRTDRPCVLLQRTTAKEQHRRLIAAALPKSFIERHGGVVIENHLNMIRPANGAPKVSPEAVSAVLNSTVVDHAFRCISGSVAVSAFELEALPLPSLKQMKKIERLVAARASADAIEAALLEIYLGREA